MTEPTRPSLREAARRGTQANRQAQPQQQPATRPATSAKPTPHIEQVAARCGHAVPFELYPDGKDKWRESRRKHITDRDCPECRQKAHEERTAAEMEAAQRRRQVQPVQAGRARHPSARLPHGSRFDVAYDATEECWSGTLTVPVEGGEPGVFTGSASGVFRLLRMLDGMYRETRAGDGGPTK